MEIDYTGRHIDVTPALRTFIEEKLRKLDRILDGHVEAHVVLAVEKHRQMAEIQVHAKHVVFSSMKETDDMYASIGMVVDKLERQARRHKEKLQGHKHRSTQRDPAVAAELEANMASAPTAVEDAPASAPAIVRTANYRVKPLSTEDAAMELDGSGDDLLVYRDADSEHICVLYRGRDGALHLVEPEL